MRQLRGSKLNKFHKAFDLKDKEIIILLDNIEYARNVASVFRIADAVKAKEVILTGVTKTPPFGKELSKVSRSKEQKIHWEYIESGVDAIERVKNEGYQVIAIEITDEAISYKDFEYPDKVCFVIGSEMHGISQKMLDVIPQAVFVPMAGVGRSLNVHVSLAVVVCFMAT